MLKRFALQKSIWAHQIRVRVLRGLHLANGKSAGLSSMSLMRLQIPKQEHRAWNIKYQPYNIAILLKEAARLGLAHLAFKMRMEMMRYNYDIRCELTAPK